jgi:hypothetical protein
MKVTIKETKESIYEVDINDVDYSGDTLTALKEFFNYNRTLIKETISTCVIENIKI